MVVDRSPLPMRLARVWRAKGAAGVWFGALSRFGYRRLVLLERRLDEPIAPVTPRIETVVRRLGRGDEAAFVGLGQEDACTFRERLRAGHQCWGAWGSDVLRHTRWYAFREARVEYLGCRVALGDHVTYMYRSFTQAEYRGLGLAPATAVVSLQALCAQGYRLVLAAVLPENPEAFRPTLKVGYRRIGVVRSIGFGETRLVRVRLDRHAAVPAGWAFEWARSARPSSPDGRGGVGARCAAPSVTTPAVNPPRVARSRPNVLTRAAYAAAAQALYWVAFLWRRRLRGTAFVAVTGTHGKTTTKELLATILTSQAPTFRLAANQNTGLPLTLNVLRVRPSHRYAVLEVGVGAPGEMRRLARLVRPDLAVVLAVLRTHVKAFPDREEHAREKAALLARLRRSGVAVLNADDPLVAAMAGVVRGRLVRFGTSPTCDVWAEGITARWPGRLEFDLRTRDGESCHVRTRLVGRHWSTSALAALAAGRALGVPLPEAVAALERVEAFRGRMQPLLLPSGAVLIRDDYDGSYDAFRAAIETLSDARAVRRVAVIADASDYGATARRKRVARLGREAAAAAEVVVFVGPDSTFGRRGAIAAGCAPENAHAFERLAAAAAFLQETIGRGDLVLLKGRATDHLARLFYTQLGDIRCWKETCPLVTLCDDCPELGAEAAARLRAAVPPPEPPIPADGAP
jgi:UDP-N-acetylmuramoyl-tripeptide--D-alanyl-D-alanine ligase